MKKAPSERIEDANFEDILGEKYLAYALSTIMSRSLPDVRDGLKPVHRRLLYAMQQLRLRPEEAYKKCARVVGDVIGKYHPHGDTAVYDTLVRLAQNFSLRYPLIDGQGNFGSIDGDNAAAMRYTESRLTALAMKLMEDLEKDTVPFKPTYDDSDSEPALFPAKFPNLLTNGAEGIAVGMATNIPPHNLDELCKACIFLISNRNAEVKDLLNFIEGPDFPTGGTVVDSKDNLLSIYETGKGSLRIRAKWQIEEFGHGLYQIVITEIPYQVQKSKLIEHIANLLKDKKIPLISNIRDESAEDIRVIIEPKTRSADAQHIMESLFKQTDLEIRFNYNLNVIGSNGLPEVMNLKRILEEFIEYRFLVVTKRSLFEKKKIEARLEILEGLKIVYLNLDEVIRIIREEDDAKEALIARFNLTDNQAEAILNTRLRSLRKLEEQTINAEHNDLSQKKKELESILDDSKKCWKVVTSEIKEIEKEFGKNTEIGARRTNFVQAVDSEVEFKIEAFIEKEPITIIFSTQGWVRSVKGAVDDISSLKFKEGDSLSLVIKAYTTDYIIFPTKMGKFYTVFADNISKGKGHGEPLRMMMDIASNDEILTAFVYNSSAKFLLASRNGKGFIVSSSDIFAQKKLGKQIMQLGTNDFCSKVLEVGDNHDMIACSSTMRKILVCKLSEIPVMKKGLGVVLIKLKDAYLQDIQLFNSQEGFRWKSSKEIKLQSNFTPWLAKRAGSGKLPPFGFLKSNNFEE